MSEVSPLLIVGPLGAAKREARARGLLRAQWHHVGDAARVQGVARGSRYVVVGPHQQAHTGRHAEILDVLAARDAVEEAPVAE